jgi:hypothetical protein
MEGLPMTLLSLTTVTLLGMGIALLAGRALIGLVLGVAFGGEG